MASAHMVVPMLVLLLFCAQEGYSQRFNVTYQIFFVKGTAVLSEAVISALTDADKTCIEMGKVFYEAMGRCYSPLQQGPCRGGEWLVYDKNATGGTEQLRGMCRPSPYKFVKGVVLEYPNCDVGSNYDVNLCPIFKNLFTNVVPEQVICFYSDITDLSQLDLTRICVPAYSRKSCRKGVFAPKSGLLKFDRSLEEPLERDTDVCRVTPCDSSDNLGEFIHSQMGTTINCLNVEASLACVKEEQLLALPGSLTYGAGCIRLTSAVAGAITVSAVSECAVDDSGLCQKTVDVKPTYFTFFPTGGRTRTRGRM